MQKDEAQLTWAEEETFPSEVPVAVQVTGSNSGTIF